MMAYNCFTRSVSRFDCLLEMMNQTTELKSQSNFIPTPLCHSSPFLSVSVTFCERHERTYWLLPPAATLWTIN